MNRELLDESKLIATIRTKAKEAAKLRLAGKMAQAVRLDRELDRLHKQAERANLADDAVEADEEGRESARESEEADVDYIEDDLVEVEASVMVKRTSLSAVLDTAQAVGAKWHDVADDGQTHRMTFPSAEVMREFKQRMAEEDDSTEVEVTETSAAPNLRTGSSGRKCGTCSHYQHGTCTLYDFTVDNKKVCDSWRGAAGEESLGESTLTITTRSPADAKTLQKYLSNPRDLMGDGKLTVTGKTLQYSFRKANHARRWEDEVNSVVSQGTSDDEHADAKKIIQRSSMSLKESQSASAPEYREAEGSKRCGNCSHYSQATCKLYDFTADPNKTCNDWAGGRRVGESSDPWEVLKQQHRQADESEPTGNVLGVKLGDGVDAKDVLSRLQYDPETVKVREEDGELRFEFPDDADLDVSMARTRMLLHQAKIATQESETSPFGTWQIDRDEEHTRATLPEADYDVPVSYTTIQDMLADLAEIHEGDPEAYDAAVEAALRQMGAEDVVEAGRARKKKAARSTKMKAGAKSRSSSDYEYVGEVQVGEDGELYWQDGIELDLDADNDLDDSAEWGDEDVLDERDLQPGVPATVRGANDYTIQYRTGQSLASPRKFWTGSKFAASESDAKRYPDRRAASNDLRAAKKAAG